SFDQRLGSCARLGRRAPRAGGHGHQRLSVAAAAGPAPRDRMSAAQGVRVKRATLLLRCHSPRGEASWEVAMKLRREICAGAGAVALALALTACAQGTSTEEGDQEESSFDPEATPSGSIQIMGFGAGDEIATTRYR